MPDTVGTKNGKISYLRVHQLQSGFGPSTDFLDAEVIVRFENDSSQAYGFQLRQNDYLPAAEAMFALLQDAFNADEPVTVDFNKKVGSNHHRLVRVWRIK